MNQFLELFWENNTASGRSIILLIAILGGFGAACALNHWRRYRTRELVWLHFVRDRLRRTGDASVAPAPLNNSGFFAEESSPPEGQPEPEPLQAKPAIELQELLVGVPPETLVGDRLATIAKMRQVRARMNIDALQQSTILKESANWSLSLPAYIVSLVMMLGLLGTFIGLSLMVVDIQQALPDAAAQADASQWASSVSSLGRILAGKKTAFSATLAGLFFSIVVSAFNFALARAQSEFYDRLERFTAEELLPVAVPAFDDAAPWERLSAQLGDSFDNLGTLTTEQARSTERMIAVEKTFATVIENIENITQRAATAPLQGMTGEITNVVGLLAQVNGTVIGVTEKLPQIVTAFRESQQTTLSAISTAMQAQQLSVERLTRAIQSGRAAGFQFDRVSFAAGGAVIVVTLALLLHWLA